MILYIKIHYCYKGNSVLEYKSIKNMGVNIMKKIRNSFLKSIDLEQAVQYDKLMSNDLMIGYYSEGLFFSELNYLTFDELVYLYDNE